MESRDWRHGWAADDPRWTERPAEDTTWNGFGSSPASSNGNGANGNGGQSAGGHSTGGHSVGGHSARGAADLWGEPPYVPQPLLPPPLLPRQPISGPPAGGSGAYTGSGFGNPSTTSTGGIPALRGPSGPQPPVRSGYGVGPTQAPPPPPPAVRGPAVGPGSPLWTPAPGPFLRNGGRPGLTPRRRPRPRPMGRDQRDFDFPDEPSYGTVLALTAGWYLLPGLVYLIWLLTVGNDRPGSSGPDLGAGLPWLIASVVLSLAVAGLLRWAIVGWRALTLSFAAAVIGAGVATIAHSLAAG